MTKEILDWQGNVIGQLVFPDETPDEVWQAKLAEYAKPPVIISAEEIVKAQVSKTIDFGRELIVECGTYCVLRGITTEQIKEVTVRTSDVNSALSVGSLQLALEQIDLIDVDGEIITQELVDLMKGKIKKYLGIEDEAEGA